MKKILSIILLSILIFGCEKDDICDPTTATTPRIILEFYNFSQQSMLKNISNLNVTGIGSIIAPKDYITGTKIELPLKISDGIANDVPETVSYKLQLNSTIPASSNEDVVTFNYTKNTIYVSRACGYKTTFNLLSNGTEFIITDPLADGNWIKGYEIETRIINNENETHIKIYF